MWVTNYQSLHIYSWFSLLNPHTKTYSNQTSLQTILCLRVLCYHHCFVWFRSLPNKHVLTASNPRACTVVDSQHLIRVRIKLKGQGVPVQFFWSFVLFLHVVVAVVTYITCYCLKFEVATDTWLFAAASKCNSRLIVSTVLT